MTDTTETADLAARLAGLTVADEHRLRRQLRRGRRRLDPGELAAAEARVEARRASVPELRYPADLPITERREELVAAIRDHQVVVVAGETGSGKSTQLPKLCLEAGRGVRGMIGHTQPRRIAARAVAERVAEELGCELGTAVGYTVRFTDRVSDSTLVKVMTDGILLAEVQRDRLLTAYDTIIVDEAHERSLNIDFLLGYLHQLLPKRPDLRVVITSATIDTARFAAHFGGAPVVEVSGRTYPVEVRYRPFGVEPDDDRDQTQAIVDAVGELAAEGPGDVLVFLSGEREIRDTADALARAGLPPTTEVLPLYARLSAAEQHRVFAPHRGRRIVLATNVAETSLTVPGIRAVVDPGFARISRFNRRTKVQRLPIEPISRASADQRAGRCGRVGPGVCIRLYSEEDHAARPEFTDPEILRTNLASVVLQMAALRLGDPNRFPFVDPPDPRAVRDGVTLLRELGALDGDRLTPIGRQLARLPVDPRIGRMIVEADRNGCAREVLVIAAALSIQDPRERPTGREQEAGELHARFADPDSDFIAYLNLWRYLREAGHELGSSQFRKLCRAEHLNHLRVREWEDLHAQLRTIARGLGIRLNDQPADHDSIHRSLLAGLLSHVGTYDPERREYLGPRQSRFTIAPGSVLHRRNPKWIMAAELVETDRLRARTVARIRPEWVDQAGAHLVKRSHGEPWWDRGRAAAMVDEKVTLFGLTVVPRRPVPYARVDPEGARDVFIQRALVEGDWDAEHAFLATNRARIEQVRSLEDRTRRRDLLVGEDVLFELYDERVPGHVTSGAHFDRWWRDERHRDPQRMELRVEELVEPGAELPDPEAFPDTWRHGDLELRLRYRFDPGHDLDGVTVDVPLELLNRLGGARFDWHVPGFREELVGALIRSLPKQLRRNFVPVPDHARAFLAAASPGDGPLVQVLARHLARSIGEPVPADAFDLTALPPHLRMTIRAVDGRGRPLAWSKDLGALRRRLAPRVRAAVAGAAASLERTGLTSWTIGDLPRVVEVDRGGHAVRAHPALVDEGGSVAVRVLASEAEQARAMWAGTRRLLLLSMPGWARRLKRAVGDDVKLSLAAAPHGTVAEVLADCAMAAVDHLLATGGGPAWDADGFARLQEHVEAGFLDGAVAAAQAAAAIAATAGRAATRLDRLVAPALQPSVADMRSQLDRLVGRGFVSATGVEHLRDLLRWVRAIDVRLDRLAEDPGRDLRLMQQVHRMEDEAAGEPAVQRLLEELRVATFAPSLGTPVKVSEQRIRKELARLRRARGTD